MKRLSAIVLSLLILWVQLFVMARPVRADAPAKCACCARKKTDCCVSQSSDTPAPLPVATVQTTPQNLNSFSLTSLVAWTLPRAGVEFSAADNTSPLDAARVPIFTRHCVLLI